MINISCSFLLSSRQCGTKKRQFQFKGIRHNTVNVIIQNLTSTFLRCKILLTFGQISTVEQDHSKSVCSSGECLITELQNTKNIA